MGKIFGQIDPDRKHKPNLENHSPQLKPPKPRGSQRKHNRDRRNIIGLIHQANIQTPKITTGHQRYKNQQDLLNVPTSASRHNSLLPSLLKCKKWFPSLDCTLESLMELFKVPMPRPHPRPVKLVSDSGSRNQYLLFPGDSNMQPRLRGCDFKCETENFYSNSTASYIWQTDFPLITQAFAKKNTPFPCHKHKEMLDKWGGVGRGGGGDVTQLNMK